MPGTVRRPQAGVAGTDRGHPTACPPCCGTGPATRRGDPAADPGAAAPVTMCLLCRTRPPDRHHPWCPVGWIQDLSGFLATMAGRWRPQPCQQCTANPGHPHSRYCAAVTRYRLEDDPVDQP